MSKELDELKAQWNQLLQQGKYTEAEPLLVQAAQLTRKEFGDQHVATASILNEIGGLYRATGEYAKSESAFVEATEILARFPGKDHPDYATTINNLAGLYRLMGEHSKGEALFIEANEIYANTLGKDAVRLINMVYTNAWSKLGIGKCRYGLMLNEHGMVFDDGVTTRLGENHFHMTTTTGGAARVRP